MASFRSRKFDFVAIAAHIRWGKESGRKKELELLADWIEAKRKDEHHEDKDIIVIGDFSIPSRDNDLFKAIMSKGNP